ncbi:radical SAM protein [Paenibacillus sp. FSL H8-0317]|uniref:radical SAM protein n=1 Tax=Paenibacillus sp. FSL H8-0317 TaxID=2921385 RepID=UPI003249F79E
MKLRSTISGIHLFNRQTGFNLLLDEVVLPQKSWSTAPRQVSIALTNACDLDCPYCYAPKKPAVIPLELLKKWLIELDQNGCFGIGFGGGEPTLYPWFKELCRYAMENTTLAVTMTTHAHNLSDSALSELDGNLNFIRVSMDGVGSTYETLRKRRFETLLERIVAIKKVANFGINYVVNSKTIGDLDSAIEIAEELQCSEFLLIPEVAAGRGKEINQETLNDLRKWVEDYRGNIPLSISEKSSNGFPISNPLKFEKGLFSFAHIDASGILKRSSYDLNGIQITKDGVIFALDRLKKIMEDEEKLK